jgi:threonyl-tRNA synthetase
MTNQSSLEAKRHSLSHLLAAAVLEFWPEAKPTLGPPVDNGFYYDFDFPIAIAEADLAKIEERMVALLKTWDTFQRFEVTAQEAKAEFKDNQYKHELIDGIAAEGGKITIYQSGKLRDLCRGGHVEHANEIKPGSWKLDRLAGAYWRGDEHNKMLTRIYGLAFDTKQELAAYLKQREEAAKRDHKKLGVELDLFTFSDLVGPGLPLWTPKGTTLRNLLDAFVWELREKRGYMRVEIPHITKKELYEMSGHWDKFKNELFRITTREGHEFAMKPMNCPHHTQIYARRAWSYRELPQRYANTTTCYRDEQTGELAGLSRVRAFAQDDAHVFCRMNQVKEEFLKIWDIVQEFYPAFGFNLRVRLSIHDPLHQEKYLGDPEHWTKAENILREIVTEKKIDWFEGLGEAAFYGPKLDFMAKDAIGREWQVATIQLDMNMPERFNLTCMSEAGQKERIVMIHAAIMGSIERFLSILIEHTAGAFPTWLAPVQVKILPVGESHQDFCQKLADTMRQNYIRVEVDDANETIGNKIRKAEHEKVPYSLVIGDKEIASGQLAIRRRGQKELTNMERGEFISQLLQQIKTRQPISN